MFRGLKAQQPRNTDKRERNPNKKVNYQLTVGKLRFGPNPLINAETRNSKPETRNPKLFDVITLPCAKLAVGRVLQSY